LKLKIGDRVAIYSQFGRQLAVVTSVNPELCVRYDKHPAFEIDDKLHCIVHPKQCRKLIKKEDLIFHDEYFKFVKFEGFEIQITPVTQVQWNSVMDNNPSCFKDNKNNPVETVSWDDTQEFISRLNRIDINYIYNLPTEEQWLTAAGPIPENIHDHGWFCENSNKTIHPVAQKKPNIYGLYDMRGNIWEWCFDKDGSNRVLRGSSWFNNAQLCRSALRSSNAPGFRVNNLGFRLLRNKYKS